MACSNTLPRLRPGVCCLRHLARLSPRRRFNLVRLRSDLACILPGYARHSAAQRPTSSFVFPISFTGRELRERASARDLPRSRLSATYPPRIRCDTARCGGAGPAPPRRLTCDLLRCPRRAPARGGGTDAALLRGSTRPRASALTRPQPPRGTGSRRSICIIPPITSFARSCNVAHGSCSVVNHPSLRHPPVGSPPALAGSATGTAVGF